MNPKNSTFVCYKTKSKGGKALARGLGLKMTAYENVDWPQLERPERLIINWGSTQVPQMTLARVINTAAKVNVATDKHAFFLAMSKAEAKPRLPEWTADAKVAVEWAKAGDQVLARAMTRASAGRGILFYGDADLAEFLKAALFTKYVKKKSEWRVHFAFGKQIDVQKKGLRHDVDKSSVDYRIQTHSNGFIFLRENVVAPDDVLKQAELAYAASGLDFGAVDAVYNESREQAYVLEINTAPGLEGTTVENYVRAFAGSL